MGNGNFMWWAGPGSEPESYSGPFLTRDEAIEAGREEFEDGFTICEADKSVLIDRTDGEDLAEHVTDHLIDCNEECWGEDGPNGEAWSDAAMKELAKALERTVADWLAKHPAKTWAFGNMRNEEYFAAEAAE